MTALTEIVRNKEDLRPGDVVTLQLKGDQREERTVVVHDYQEVPQYGLSVYGTPSIPGGAVPYPLKYWEFVAAYREIPSPGYGWADLEGYGWIFGAVDNEGYFSFVHPSGEFLKEPVSRIKNFRPKEVPANE